jgi:DNA-binding transcriptional LysR family regulator
VDLHLIRTFFGIYETGSLTRTAEALHVTQPSVSYALRRLRAELNDPVFIRDGSGMYPTVHATELYDTSNESIRRIDAVAIGEVDAAIASVPIPGARHADVIRDDHYVCILTVIESLVSPSVVEV